MSADLPSRGFGELNAVEETSKVVSRARAN